MRAATTGRERVLAASFIVSVSIVPGCGSPGEPATTTGGNGGCEPPDCHMNPPPLETTSTASAATTTTATATAVATWKLCSATGDEAPCVRKDPAGVCMLIPKVMPCTGSLPCNPPAPYKVDCP